MANKIQVKRGALANLPTLSVGEPAFTTDTNQFYVGNGTSNIELAKATDLSDLMNNKADLASPNFTGAPTIATKTIAVTSYHVKQQSEILNGFTLDTTQENVFIKVGNLNRLKLAIISTTDISNYTDVALLTDDVLPVASYVSIRQPDSNGNIVDIIAVNGTKRVQVKGMKANVKLCFELQWISN